MNFSKGAGDNNLTFPLTQAAMAALLPCDLASPRVGNPHGLDTPVEFNDLPALAKEVCEVRSMVARGEFPRTFMAKYYPTDWGDFPDEIPAPLRAEGLWFGKPEGLADVVHMDNPLDMGAALLSWLLSQGYRPKQADERFKDFLSYVPQQMALMADIVDAALSRAFDAKYYFGVARPEEVEGWNLTAYPEGCPTHPSYPAGHGAAAGASAQHFLDAFDLDDMAIKVIRDTAYIWSMARSLAGVHYAQDNLAGMQIGGMDL